MRLWEWIHLMAELLDLLVKHQDAPEGSAEAGLLEAKILSRHAILREALNAKDA